ncbi:MAG: hypothetical protein WA860_13555, partial [Acidimicrobiales bacterium]
AFGELSDDLFGGVMPLLHAVLLAPFWSIGTLVSSGSFQRGLRNSGHFDIKRNMPQCAFHAEKPLYVTRPERQRNHVSDSFVGAARALMRKASRLLQICVVITNFPKARCARERHGCGGNRANSLPELRD